MKNATVQTKDGGASVLPIPSKTSSSTKISSPSSKGLNHPQITSSLSTNHSLSVPSPLSSASPTSSTTVSTRTSSAASSTKSSLSSTPLMLLSSPKNSPSSQSLTSQISPLTPFSSSSQILPPSLQPFQSRTTPASALSPSSYCHLSMTDDSDKKEFVGYDTKFCINNKGSLDVSTSLIEYENDDKKKRNKTFMYSLVPIDIENTDFILPDDETHLLHKAHHSDPFSILGSHQTQDQYQNKLLVVRAWVQNAESVQLKIREGYSEMMIDKDADAYMEKRCDFLFQKVYQVMDLNTKKPVKADTLASFSYYYEVKYDGENTTCAIYDPYSFGLVLSEFDLKLFQSGSCWHVDNLMGSHIVSIEGITGVRFSVWAPNCTFVSVVGDWNGWDGRIHPMRKRHEFGVWELFIPSIGAGEKYGFRIHSKAGNDFIKIDPYAQEFECPPKTASIVSSCDDAFKNLEDRFPWTDKEWMEERTKKGLEDEIRREPMAIYEVHIPSWMRGDDNTYLSYREVADRLLQHVKNLNFTHVEFLPLAHHPFEGSWGYQVTGQYAPYSRLGNPDDLKYLINRLHEEGIGVFIDLVPAHFCRDDWGLVYFDGEPCYEYEDPREGEHKLWGTNVYNFRRNEVRSYLLGIAYHWLRRYHVDGLRIDAVSSMLYKNHQRNEGEWLPNENGGIENLQAISLLKEMNWVIHEQFPGVFTMAEESTSWKGVTDRNSGLGFDAKWDLGWMNDTLCYLTLPAYKHPECHNKLTFRGLYMAHEKWILPLSHDEVVSGKGSLVDKCGFQGVPFEDRIKTLRTLYGFQVGLPGRPLIFMGGEIAQGREWKETRSVDWHEGNEELRSKVCLWLSELLAVYKHHKALHAGDDEVWNFKWTDCENSNDCIIAFLRSYMEWYNDILVICNFSNKTYYRYPVGVLHGGEWKVLLNSDDWRYGGSMQGPGNLSGVVTTEGGRLGWPYCLWLDIPPLGCLYLQCPQPLSPKSENKVGEIQEQK